MILVLALAAGLRVGVLAAGLWAGGSGLVTPDSAGYLANADTLAWHGRFAADPAGPPEIVRTPGYPLLIAAVERAAGVRAAAGQAPPRLVVPLLALQIALDVLLVYLAYRLARAFVEPGPAVLAAAIQATSAVAVAASARVLTDSLTALLVTAALLCLVRHLRRRSLSPVVLAAVLLAAATYLRPIAMLLPLALAPPLLRRRPPGRLAPALLLAVFAACLAPWVVRNAAVAGYPDFSAIGAVNLHEYNAPALEARLTGADEAALRQRARDETQARAATTPPADLYRWKERRAMGEIARHPVLYAWVHLRANLGTLLPGVTDVLEIAGVTAGQRGTLAVLRRDGLAAAVRHYFGGNTPAIALAVPSVLLLAATYLGAAIAAIRGVRHRPTRAQLLLVLTALYFLLLPGPAAHPRFRVLVMPVLSIAAAAGLAWLLQRAAARLGRRRWQTAATHP